MNCPSCQTEFADGDKFCEVCGTAIVASGSDFRKLAPVPLTSGCQKCGVHLDQIDPEGFCLSCGFRNVQASDRWSLEVSDCFAGATDPGCRHPHNEDSMQIREIKDGLAAGTAILLVCDGVSSSGMAIQASSFAVNHTTDLTELNLQSGQPAAAAILDAIAQTQLKIQQNLPANPGKEPPSTTLVSAIVQGERVTIAWVGDSRAYWIDDQPQLLSQDHSWMNEVVAAGEMTIAEANRSPQAHAITRWLGADASPTDSEASLCEFEIPGPGYLLLCSDGLWNYAPDAIQLKQLMPLQGNALSIAQSLVEQARSRGGHDNITVALLHIPPKPA
jgi:PPM family protein phosphatase